MNKSITAVIVVVLAFMIAGNCYAKDKKGDVAELEKAEAQVLKLAKPYADRSTWAEENAKALAKFENIIKKNPQSLDYDFKDIKVLVEIVESEDHNLRFYQWWNHDVLHRVAAVPQAQRQSGDSAVVWWQGRRVWRLQKGNHTDQSGKWRDGVSYQVVLQSQQFQWRLYS